MGLKDTAQYFGPGPRPRTGNRLNCGKIIDQFLGGIFDWNFSMSKAIDKIGSLGSKIVRL